MKAQPLIRFKDTQGELIVEMVIWQLPETTQERPQGLKYRLFCGRKGECLVRYDNEAGKGDHRHYGAREEAYEFQGIEKLLADFRTDCERTGWKW